MSPILREALRRVRESGDFVLLDCLELIDRRNNGEPGAFAMTRWCGHTLIGYGDVTDSTNDNVDCPACEGDGELEAYGANGKHFYVGCPQCSGDGYLHAHEVDVRDLKPELDKVAWRTLNGDAFDIHLHGNDSGPKVWGVMDAEIYISKARADLAAPKEQAA